MLNKILLLSIPLLLVISCKTTMYTAPVPVGTTSEGVEVYSVNEIQRAMYLYVPVVKSSGPLLCTFDDERKLNCK